MLHAIARAGQGGGPVASPGGRPRMDS